MTYGNYPDLSLVKRILVVKMRHHGDVLLTAPLFSVLKRALPSAQIDALIYEDTLPMLEGHPGIANYLLCDRSRKAGKLWREMALFRQVRRCRYDLVLNLTEGDRGAVAALVSGARYKMGLDPKNTGFFGKRRLYTHLIKACSQPRHTVERHLDAARCMGIFPGPAERDLFLHIPQEATDAVQRLLALNPGGNYVVVHPVSRWRFKCASVRQMAEVVQGLEARGLSVVLSAGPDPQEKRMVEEILALVPGSKALNAAGRLSLKELAALIAAAKGLICVDSVPLHIASATKTPVVALFGPTSELNWGPWMHPQAQVIIQTVSCRPCFQDGCGGSKMSDCLFSIPPQRVLKALDELLSDESR